MRPQPIKPEPRPCAMLSCGRNPCECWVHASQLEFFTAILLAVSENRAQSLAVMEDFIANLKSASQQ